MNRAAMPPQRRAYRSNASPPSSLLFPQFLARSRNFPARFGRMRSGPLSGSVMLHRFPKQVFVDRAKDFVGQLQRTDLFAAQIVNVNRCHDVFMEARASSPVQLSLL